MLKICGIRDIETALFAAEHGATAIGLVFTESLRRIDTSIATEITRQLHSLHPDVLKVAVLRHRDLPAIPSILQQVKIDLIQVHGAGPLDSSIANIPVLPAGSLAQVHARIHDTVLVDSPAGAGLGLAWDYAQALELTSSRKVILAGGLSPKNVANAVQKAQSHGVDVSSGVESSKGIKDNSMIKDFLQAAKSALHQIQNTREICNK